MSDTGTGIPEEDRQRALDEIYRSANARAQCAESTGIGTAIVQAVVGSTTGGSSLRARQGAAPG